MISLPKVLSLAGFSVFAFCVKSVAVTAQSSGSSSPATSRDSSRDSIVTSKGVCHIWTQPYGGSNFPQDASYSPCALERAPALMSSAPMPGPPLTSVNVSGNYRLIINADGTVNRNLSRMGSSMSGTGNYFDIVADSMAKWRFHPGMRAGKAVRSARKLEINTVGSRNDTLPAHINWTFRAGREVDSVIGTWVSEAALPQLSNAHTDSLYMTFLHKLVAMKVMVPLFGAQHCLVMHNGDAEAHARLQVRARVMSLNGGPFDFGIDNTPPFFFAPYGCERTADPIRIILPRVHRSEHGRVTFETGGDFLPNYPNDITGRSWRGWRARCTGTIPDSGSISLTCDVGVGDPYVDFGNWYRNNIEEARRNALRARSRGDSVWTTAVVTTENSAIRDTIRSVISTLPLITEHAVVDSKSPCGGWIAFSEQGDSAQLYIINGNPSSYARELDILKVRRGIAPQNKPDRECPAQTEHSAKFAAFVPGGIGTKATSPITFVFTGEATPYVIDPSRHTIEPHLTFPVSSLRSGKGASKRIQMILKTETNHSVFPIVVMPTAGSRPHAVVRAAQISVNTFRINAQSDFPPDGKVFVYLIRLQ